MLVKELYISIVDPLRNRLANLMWCPSLDHVQGCPSILGLSSGGGAHEEGVLQLALQVVLFDMVCEHCWDLPVGK